MPKTFPHVRWLLAACSVSTLVAGELPDGAEWHSVVSRLVAKNDGHGSGIARLAPASGPALIAVSGRLAGEGSAAMEDGTPFEVASVTKAVTAATVLRLCERGVLGLDWTLERVLPARAIQSWDPQITIRQLLSHTSGLPDYWTDGKLDRQGRNAFLREFLADPSREWAPIEMLDHARAMPARRKGGRFHYSDTNYVLLGLIIERACGRALHDVFRREIFDPLGMKTTWMSFKERAKRTPVSHRYEGAEDLTVAVRQTADWAGGGLISTAGDLEMFLRGLFSGALVSPASLAEMCRWVPVGEDGISYGLGLYRVELDEGQGELIGHDGHGNAFAYFWPQRGIALTGTLNQYDNDWWPLAESMTGGEPAFDSGMETPVGTLEGALSAGWDSLYLYRGVNVLGGSGYGSGIQTTTLALALPEAGPISPSLEVSQAFSTGSIDYSETSITLEGDFSLGDFDGSLGYNVSLGSSDGFFQSHELVGRFARGFELGPVSVTPSFEGVLGLGPETVDGGGGGRAGCGYLAARIDAAWLAPGGLLELGAWTEAAVNLGYNSRETADGELQAFDGWNNVVSGVAVTLWPAGKVSLSAYGAWSHALADFSETQTDTFFGGGQVTVGF